MEQEHGFSIFHPGIVHTESKDIRPHTASSWTTHASSIPGASTFCEKCRKTPDTAQANTQTPTGSEKKSELLVALGSPRSVAALAATVAPTVAPIVGPSPEEATIFG